ncbi:hypothetical protein Tco_0147970, partial [Tanacetum coccineum]
ENPTTGTLDSFSFAFISSLIFLKKRSDMNSEELPPSTYILETWKPSIYASNTIGELTNWYLGTDENDISLSIHYSISSCGPFLHPLPLRL